MPVIVRQIFLISLIFLLLQLSTRAAQQQYKYIVSGRAVNKNGQPVAHARIVLWPSEPQILFEGDNAVLTDETSDETSDDGRFRYVGITHTLTPRQVLYVTAPPPPNALSLLQPPFGELSSDYRPFPGQPIFVNVNQELNVGDVPIQVQYDVVLIQLQDHAGKLLLTNVKDWKNVWVRLRDPRGDSIAEESLSIADIRKSVDVAQSALRIALPQGTWHIEISTHGMGGSWLALAEDLNVQGLGNLLPITLRQPITDHQVSPASKSGQRNTKSAEEARLELERLGFEFSEKSFLERVNRLNAKAVRLFLDAGINPNAKSKSGMTPLISAAMQGDIKIVQMLIDKGADVNAKKEDGATALMGATTGGFSSIVRVLLAHGANVNAQHENGTTALINAVSIGATGIVKDLLEAGADVSLKSKDGHTALDIAKDMGNKEMIRLLTKVELMMNLRNQ